ncbi:phosphopantetheine-binding protein [Streptomyces hydrogenans]|uniref:phosphopantetheine-binding protein n=1 Tax=Streptomyces hydrogenans TaxID=1873719 RepID=UPI0037F91B11
MSTPEHLRGLPSGVLPTDGLPSDALPSSERAPAEGAPAEGASAEGASDAPPSAGPSDAAEALRPQVAVLVSRSTDGLIGVRELLDSTEPLAALGVSSLSLLRLVDAVEETYGVFVDLGDRTLHTEGLRGLTERLVRLGAEATP